MTTKLPIITLAILFICLSLHQNDCDAFQGQYVINNSNQTVNICEKLGTISGAIKLDVIYPEAFFRITNKVNDSFAMGEFWGTHGWNGSVSLSLSGNSLTVTRQRGPGLTNVTTYLKNSVTPTDLDCFYAENTSIEQFHGHFISETPPAPSNDSYCHQGNGKYTGYYTYLEDGKLNDGIIRAEMKYGVMYGKWIEGTNQGDYFLITASGKTRGVFWSESGTVGGYNDFVKTPDQVDIRTVGGSEKCVVVPVSEGTAIHVLNPFSLLFLSSLLLAFMLVL